MNPAALKQSLGDLRPNGIVIVNTDEFNARNLKKAGYETNPLEDGSLDGYRLFSADISTMTRRALEDSPLDFKSRDRCKNFFALGMIYWLFSRPLETSIDWLERKFKRRPEVAEANIKALKAGYNFCDITDLFQVRYEVEPAQLAPAPTATSWATRRWPSGWWPPAAAAACRCSSAPTRSRRPATSCTSWRGTRTSAS